MCLCSPSRHRNDGYVGTDAGLSAGRHKKVLTLQRLYNYQLAHFVFEMLPIVDAVTDFVLANPDVMILLPDGTKLPVMMRLWPDVDPGRYFVPEYGLR